MGQTYRDQVRMPQTVAPDQEAVDLGTHAERFCLSPRARRRREWLLDIAFTKRETFAYACETFSRFVELADSTVVRRELLAEAEAGPMPSDERGDAAEYLDILREAVAARNGWKRILARCAQAPSRQAPTPEFAR